MPLAVTRGFGGFRACNSLMLFASGLVGSAGTCTSDNKYPCARLPRHKVPTAIASANNNEFALVTVWDVKELKGQLAVFALGSHHADFWDLDWKVLMPCFPNGGGHTFIKLLGYVDLPGMDAPTGVTANTRIGSRPGWLQLPGGGNANPPQIDLSKQEVRDSFTSPRGVNRNWVPTTGYAAVISRSEKKVAFVDLGPLVRYARMMYLGTQENHEKTLDVGTRPDEWPYTFEHEPRWRPRLVQVVDLPQMPTAVLAALTDGAEARCHVATVDGRLYAFRVDGLTGPAPRPDRIAPMGVVKVGRNPCWLAYHKNHWGGPNPETMDRELLVVCRGDREVQWVRYSGWRGEVYKRLRDSRLVDPVHVEVADNHGTCGYVITVCDFRGRKILNYRYGPVIYHTNGGAVFELPPGDGPGGRAEFECGGVMEFPGHPFAMSGANVP